jgi:hypothetical protein
VLAGLGRAVAEADARAVDLHEPARQLAVQSRCDLGVDERSAPDEVVAGEHVRDLEHGCDRHTARLALRRDRLLRHAGEQRRVELVQLGRRLEPRRDRVEPLVLERRRLAEPRAHRPPLPRRQHDDSHVAVRAREDRVEPRLRTPASRGEGRRATHRGRAVGGVHGLGRRLEDREVDVIPAAGLEAVPVGDERRPRRLDRCRLGGHPARWGKRVAAGEPGAAEDAAHGRVQGVVGLPVPVVAGLAEVGDRGDHELGVAGQHVVGTEAERSERPRARRLDPHVRRFEQRQQSLAVSFEIDRHAALVRVADGERERHAAGAGSARWLDADYVGAEVGEEPAAGFALLVGHVDDAQAGEQRFGLRFDRPPERPSRHVRAIVTW